MKRGVSTGKQTRLNGPVAVPKEDSVSSSSAAPKSALEWLAENRQAINAYNNYVDSTGIWSDGLRQF